MSHLPQFTENGLLPPGEFVLSPGDFEQSLLVAGPASHDAFPNWDGAWRRKLVENLGILVRQLWQVGITEIFVNGSFVEDKEHPNDIDGYFECELTRLASGDLQRELNLLDPHKIWTWDPASRRTYRGYPKLQLPMWHQIASNCIRTLANCAAFEINMEMNLNSLRPFGCRAMASRKASSRLEHRHDPK